MNFKSIYEESKTALLIFGIISWVLFIIIPMPGFILDICFCLLLAFSMIVLMIAGSIKSWDNLKTFPMIMLMSTIFRIAFSIATTRQIISGESPGDLIPGLGHLVVGENIAIGLIMFVILIIVGFVIANGASRFGEVSARFMLDALPGKQMSIDNELNQGVIDDKTAKKQKKKLQMQVDFYGSLDGAGKYIKGDVWISVTMILINLIVGLIVGMVQLNLSFTESINTFTILSIGDGLTALVSSLMVIMGGALVMAKVEGDDEGKENDNKSILANILAELLPNPSVLYVTGTAFIGLAIAGLPFFKMVIPGLIIIYLGYTVQKRNKRDETDKVEKELIEKRNINKEVSDKTLIKREVEPISIEAGYKLTPYFMENGGVDVFGKKRETLFDKVDTMRAIFANKYGIVIPKAKARDDTTLSSTKYVIKIKEVVVGSGVIKKDKVLAVSTNMSLGELQGEKTKEPIYGQDAYWIDESQIENAIDNSYDVWNPITIMATHMHQVIETNMHQFISLQQVANMVKEVGVTHPILKDKMDKLEDSLHILQKVIISLLKEKISIKDLPTIIEAFIEAINQTKETDTIVSLVRQRISRQICENYIHKDGKIYLISVKDESSVEVINQQGNYILTMDYNWQTEFASKLKKQVEDSRAINNIEPVVIVNRPELRPAVSRMLESQEVNVPVISAFELPLTVKNKVIAAI